ENGIFGTKNSGSDFVIAPKSPTVLKSMLEYIATAVKAIIAIKGAGIVLINFGTIYTINKVIATNTYVIVEIPIKCGTCAIKINMASAFTKPIMTALGMNFITLATLNIPNNTWITPVKTVATNK